MVAAIPTMYGGVQFRSRLEARWAAFFDLWSVPWMYEPVDYAGYIPDFFVRAYHGAEKALLLAEVKPAFDDSGFEEARHKIDSCAWKGEAICLGVSPEIASQRWADGPPLRWDWLPGIYCPPAKIQPLPACSCGAEESRVRLIPDLSDLLADEPEVQHSARCAYIGALILCEQNHDDYHAEIAKRWRLAGNVVQWKGRGR